MTIWIFFQFVEVHIENVQQRENGTSALFTQVAIAEIIFILRLCGRSPPENYHTHHTRALIYSLFRQTLAPNTRP
jgi:hypothetical protein